MWFRRVTLSAFASLQLMALISCGSQKPNTSALDGHFENSSVAKFQAAAGTVRAAAEYEPSQGVIISLNLIQQHGKNDFAAALVNSNIDSLWITVPSDFTGTVQTSPVFAGLRSLLGSKISKVKLVRQQTSGSLTVWARDWSPQSSLDANGKVGLIDFNYYPARDADDFTAQSMERLLNFDRISLPIYNEGGNFMNTRQGHCLMTTRVTDANKKAEQDDDYVLDADDITELYKAGAGCTKVTIFPRMPYEGTGHIDMWAKFLNDTTVIVSEVRSEQLSLYSGTKLTKVREIQKYFNDRAKEIQALGYKVIRLPIPGPAFGETRESFRSYTNSITVNDHVIVPRYVKPYYEELGVNGLYLDNAYLPAYEREVQKVYESLGYKVTWIEADDLIAIGGAVHCTTMQIARGL